MKTQKEKLIEDIEKLLNSYGDQAPTFIDKNLLEFMDEETLKSIINSVLIQKENVNTDNLEWLEQFKSDSE